MKSCLIIITSLLLSSFMIQEARGMSLRRGSLPDGHEISDIYQNIEENDRGLKIVRRFLEKFSGTDNRKLSSTANPSEKHHRWLPTFHEDYYGRSRKLIVSPTSSTTISAKNAKNEEDKALTNSEGFSTKEKLSINSSSQNQEVYPDVMDIAGMDYSQARRRPPIHN